jgi:hypothetical protein
MPITLQQKKAIGFNKAGWRADKHLLSSMYNGRGAEQGVRPLLMNG